MKRREVILTAQALDDLDQLIEWIAERAGAEVALNYGARLEAFCEGLAYAAERGRRRDHLRPGLRMVGFGRRAAITFLVSDERVAVLRIYYGGRNWTG